MRFSSEEERLAHPQAGLIPWPVWQHAEYFNQQLSDDQLRLMQNPSNEIDRLLALDETTLLEEFQNDSERWAAWIALACAEPIASDQDLLVFAEKLKFGNPIIFILVADVCHVNHLQYWSQRMAQTDEGKAELQRIISSKGDYAFCVAAYFGSVAMIKTLLDIEGVDAQAMLTANDYEVYKIAAKQGNVEVTNYLLEFPDVFAYAMGEPLNQIMTALEALEHYAAGASGREAIDSIKVEIQGLINDGVGSEALSTKLMKAQDQIENIGTHKGRYFEGLSPDHFRHVTDVLRYMCSGITALLSCIGVPQDRNMLAERMLNRPFFFQRPQTEEESAHIDTQLTQAWKHLALAIEQLSQPSEDAPENDGPQP
jgi:hypothetical protein